MIIHGIRAENLLKYERVELGDLPEEGLIAISGPNESGKSTVGETLCFALFGRTFSLDYGEIAKAIRWGAQRCSVEIEFSVGDARYLISRYLDDEGNHSAKLVASDDPGTPLARGIDDVEDAVFDLIGFGFEEFIESFYLAQREISTPHPHSQALKVMAGVATLEYCGAELDQERDRADAAIADAEEEIARVEAECEVLALEEGLLARLEEERDTLEQAQARAKEASDALAAAAAAYEQIKPRLDATRASGTTAGGLRALLLVIAVLAGFLWLSFAGSDLSPASAPVERLLATVPFWSPDYAAWMPHVTGGALLLFALFWGRGAQLEHRAAALCAEGAQLADRLEQAAGSESDPLGDDADEDPLNPTLRNALAERVHAGDASVREVREQVGFTLDWRGERADRRTERLELLGNEIAIERERVEEAARLAAMRDDFDARIDAARHRLDVLALAGELLDGSVQEVSHRFNQELRELVGKTLPLFTENRYQHLQIDSDLKVRTFSNEKRDFLDLDEISSGTQRQIMLAVRLGLSQQLLEKTVTGTQFLFLDEPFAFFDQRRTRSALAVLPTLSDGLTQIWIVGQEFPEGVNFARHLECSRESKALPG